MIGYMCKYAPVEIFEAFGTEICQIEPRVINFNHSDVLMHPNICSFAKSVLEDVVEKDYEGIILTTCCDSVRRLYDVLKNEFPDKFIYMIDVPRKVNDFSCSIYEKNINDLILAYEDFSKKTFDKEAFINIIKRKEEAAKLIGSPKTEKRLKLGITGARCSNEILNLLENSGVEVLFNLTCTGIKRSYKLETDKEMFSYAENILNQIPCMRMVTAINREKYLDGFNDQLDGVIFHTVKFCDNYSFDFFNMNKNYNKPVLQIETDCTTQCAGQIKTRVEAFIESLTVSEGIKISKNKKLKGPNEPMYVMGIDSGSTSTNAVILNENKELVSFSVVRTGAKSGESADKILSDVLSKANIKKDDLDLIVSTGYGRVSIPFADTTVTEISCHGKGAHYFNPNIRTILDIGGQDSKAIKLNSNGDVTDFVMNDKCAAGTGRFIEMMARTLEIDVNEIGPISLDWKEDINISNMCSVFAESEVISLIAQNKEKCDIAHGIHKSIATKSHSLLKRVGLEETYMMTGGVAKNPGVVKEVEKVLNSKLYICPEPEIVGAVGAALFGIESLKK